MDILRAWFLHHGGVLHEVLELARGSQGYHLRSKTESNLAVNSMIISCPHKLTISWLNAKESLPENFIGSTVPYVATRFFLIQQRLLCDKSFWWPYIQALPEPNRDCLHTPMWYNQNDMLWVKGTNLEAAVLHRSQKWRQEYEENIRLLDLSESQRKEWSWFVGLSLDISTFVLTGVRELYLWAATVLSSRCFPGSTVGLEPQYPVLLPVFDIANHSPIAKVKWEWNDTTCCLYNREPLRGGRAIWNNYGAKSNEECRSVRFNRLVQFYIISISFSNSYIPTFHIILCSHIAKSEIR